MFCEQYGVNHCFSFEAMDLILSYGWPGNVRELRSLVIGLLGLPPGVEIRPEHLPSELRNRPIEPEDSAASILHLMEATAGSPSLSCGSGGLLERTELALIGSILKKTSGHQEKAAEILGISSRTLRRKLQEFGGEIAPRS
jgi:DNA-binding NtrC family response regulator